MSRESLILLIGVVVFFAPSLGIPAQWKSYLLLTVGALLMVIGYTLRRREYLRKIDKGNGQRGTDSFVESTPQRNPFEDTIA